jgi:hypothetical protein
MKNSDKNNLNKDSLQATGSGLGALGGAIVGGIISGVSTGGAGIGAGITEGAKQGEKIGKETGKTLGKASDTANKLKVPGKIASFVNNPVGTVSDSVIEAIIERIIPIPFLGCLGSEKVKQFKGHIFVFFFSIVLFFTSILGGAPFVAQASSDFQTPDSLVGYVEDGYISSNLPSKSPLGGNSLDFTSITAYYHDLGYFKTFGKWHDGIDLVPNQTYYGKDKAYSLTKELILVATLSGKACSYGNLSDGYTVTIESNDGQNKTLYHHQKANFIPLDSCREIISGQPIGIMGETGNATGIHVHYMTFKKDSSGTWVEYDPLPTINQ